LDFDPEDAAQSSSDSDSNSDFDIRWQKEREDDEDDEESNWQDDESHKSPFKDPRSFIVIVGCMLVFMKSQRSNRLQMMIGKKYTICKSGQMPLASSGSASSKLRLL